MEQLVSEGLLPDPLSITQLHNPRIGQLFVTVITTTMIIIKPEAGYFTKWFIWLTVLQVSSPTLDRCINLAFTNGLLAGRFQSDTGHYVTRQRQQVVPINVWSLCLYKTMKVQSWDDHPYSFIQSNHFSKPSLLHFSWIECSPLGTINLRLHERGVGVWHSE